MFSISNSRLKPERLRPKVHAIPRAVKTRRRANPGIYANYSVLLQLYVIAKSEAAQKREVKLSGRVLKLRKKSFKPAPARLKVIFASIRLLMLKSKLAAIRISSAIEVSYQSFYK